MQRPFLRLRAVFALALLFPLAAAAFAADPDPEGLGLSGDSLKGELSDPEASAENPPLRRFALVMGVSVGGSGTQRLRYAASDARSVAALLAELGGVRPEDLVLLIEPGLSAFNSSADKLRSASASATAEGKRCEFLFYYSGHSDETGLQLGRDKLGYAQLRASMEAMPAAVRVAILDSCSSGSLTRAKGGVAKPAFLFDASSDMEGHAYITSSSEAEAAQESDSIGGSFFTHHFISALRGAADTRGEGRVTINDAYAYAYRKTLASTEDTRYGPQHAAYEINLTGTGDLVLTDLRTARAVLAFEGDLSGSLFIRDERGKLAAELDKSSGERVELGLPPGSYSVALVQGPQRKEAAAFLGAGGRSSLDASDFSAVTAVATRARGAESSGQEVDVAGYPVHLDTSILPDFSRGLYSSELDRNMVLGLLWSSARDIGALQVSSLANFDSGNTRGFQFGGLGTSVAGNAGGFQLAGIWNLVAGDARGAQLAGTVNWTGGRMAGAQFALVNLAMEGFGGIQMASAVNVSGKSSSGVQLGIVNVADELKGSQIGFVNVSKRLKGFPIGIVNIEKDGVLGAQAWWDTGNNARAAFQVGTRIAYTLVTAGVGLDAEADPFRLGIGYGLRLPLGPFSVDADLSWQAGFGNWGISQGLEARFVAILPGRGPGLIAGLSLDGRLPGLSLDAAGLPVEAFAVESRFMIGMKL